MEWEFRESPKEGAYMRGQTQSLFHKSEALDAIVLRCDWFGSNRFVLCRVGVVSNCDSIVEKEHSTGSCILDLILF